jgi:septum formation protein
MSATPLVVLASSSPRRRELLSRLGVAFEVVSPEVDESWRAGERPVHYVRRLAREKAAVVDRPDAVVLAADTTVELDGEVLGKPADAADAAAMLARLAGRSHLVHTGVAAAFGDRVVDGHSTTTVTLAALVEDDIAWYVATGEPLDKAGAYALQGVGGLFVTSIEGSASNVVGLPLHLVATLAGELGFHLRGLLG